MLCIVYELILTYMIDVMFIHYIVLLEGHPTPTSYDETCSEYGKQTLKSGMEVFCDGKWTVSFILSFKFF